MEKMIVTFRWLTYFIRMDGYLKAHRLLFLGGYGYGKHYVNIWRLLRGL